MGRGPTALSVAVEARRAGVADVLLLVPSHETLPSHGPGRFALSVSYGFLVDRIAQLDDSVVIESTEHSHRTRCAVMVEPGPHGAADFPVADRVEARVHGSTDEIDAADRDVLVVGGGDTVVEDVLHLVAAGARVVLSFTGDRHALSPLAAATLGELEHSRALTVLWSSSPDAVTEADGYPMVHFDDRRTPDLSFDDVVVRPDHRVADGAPVSGRLYRVNPSAPATDPHGPARIVDSLLIDHPRLPAVPRPRPTHPSPAPDVPSLGARHYNATITHFDRSHEDLWVIRVRADQPDTRHLPGQYTTLGLGYWEPRADDAEDRAAERKRMKLIRRSYSISGRIFDEAGYLWDPRDHDEIEFYIVHVRPDPTRVPALTPRLALKNVGDRVYLGPKIAGRYTLRPVTDPSSDVVFLATGTGEAPHNAMIPELLRKGHHGSIVSVVTVRHLRDLGYRTAHRQLEDRFPNYRYVVLPTREPGTEKRYIQDVIASDGLAQHLGSQMDPNRTHVFLCGNPRMIGLPDWRDGVPHFPDEPGVTEQLSERGFDIDRRGHTGNVHYEEYW